MAAPPAATRRWNSTSASLTLPPGITPSKVAALMIRLRRVSGPRAAGAKTGGGAGRAVRGMGPPLSTWGRSRTLGSVPALPADRQHRLERWAADTAGPARLVAAGGRRPAGRVADGQGGDEAAGGTDGARDEHGGAEPGGELGGVEGRGPGQAGEQRQDGDRQQTGGAGHDVVDRRSDARALG